MGSEMCIRDRHTGTADSLGTIISWNTTANFVFDDNQMDAETIYHIAAIAGEGDAQNGIDLSDACLSISQGIPVVFHDLPNAFLPNTPAICLGEEARLVLGLEGEPPFTLHTQP